jgi:hypothetical protein
LIVLLGGILLGPYQAIFGGDITDIEINVLITLSYYMG